MSRVLISIGALQVVTIAVGLLRSKFLSGLLGPAGFGVVSTIDQIALALVSLGALSLPFTALKFMAEAHSKGADAFQRIGSLFLRTLGVLAVATCAIAFVLVWQWPALFAADLANYRLPLLLAVLGIPALMLNIMFVNILASAQRATAASSLGAISAAVLLVAAVIGSLLGGITGLYLASLLAGVLITAWVTFRLRRDLGVTLLGRLGGIKQELRQRPEILSYSAFIYIAMAAYSLTLLALRTSVLTELGEVAAGLLQGSLSIALTLGAVLGAMNSLHFTPFVNREIPLSQKTKAANDFARKTLVLLLIGALPVILVPQLVLRVLYTSAFQAAASSLFMFVLWQCIYQTGNVYHQLLIGLNDVRYTSLATASGFAVAAMSFPPLIAELGVGGAGLGLALGMCVRSGGAVLRLRLRHDIPVPRRVILQSALVGGVVVTGGMLFSRGDELSVSGLVQRGGFALIAMIVIWFLLAPWERSAIRGGPRAFLRALQQAVPGR